MSLVIKTDCSDIDWYQAAEIYHRVRMGERSPALLEQAFQHSLATCVLFQDNQLIALGRAISDGIYQAVLCDIAVRPDHQRQGYGKRIVSHLMEQLDVDNIILFTSPGQMPFYQQFGFHALKAGMGWFRHPEERRQGKVID